MQLRRKHKEGAEVFTEALNDIMFFLLLFFLIIATMVSPSAIKVNLPNSKAAETVTKDKVVLSVTKEHKYFLNDIEVRYDILEPTLLAETKAKGTEFVRLRLDQELTIQDLADVLQIGSKLNLKMVIATQGAKK
ncbi:MAG: biopolymer transport protein ExbD [Bacteroidetes bacterium]|nr:MAG: biopolymer transport protein ExbD [Bacteroidota bacterium]